MKNLKWEIILDMNLLVRVYNNINDIKFIRSRDSDLKENKLSRFYQNLRIG